MGITMTKSAIGKRVNYVGPGSTGDVGTIKGALRNYILVQWDCFDKKGRFVETEPSPTRSEELAWAEGGQ